jgi:hypothetical protein
MLQVRPATESLAEINWAFAIAAVNPSSTIKTAFLKKQIIQTFFLGMQQCKTFALKNLLETNVKLKIFRQKVNMRVIYCKVYLNKRAE